MANGLAQFLLERQAVGEAELARANTVAGSDGSLVAAIERLALIPGPDLVALVSEFYGVAVVAEDEWPQRAVLQDDLSRAFLRDNRVMPLAEEDNSIVVAVADPGHHRAIRALKLAVGRSVELRVAGATDILNAIEQRTSGDVAGPVVIDSDGSLDAHAGSESGDVAELRDLALGAPIVRYVNELLLEAVRARATDLHIEPFRGQLKLRLRIDGVLRNLPQPDAGIARAIVSRIKILSGLDIGERRLPQDGSKRLTIEGRPLDIRVATVPTLYGEAVAIRFLDSMQRAMDLARLGFGGAELDALKSALEAPYGMIVVTGPTGSGKTTTLGAALDILNTPSRKILTVEDPVEMQIEGVNQVQVKPDIGLTFAEALRHFLRHDPDVILVGEMRDGETARIGVQAALTGHLVLTTLHTNSAAGAIPRLLDMGVDAFLIASSLRAVVGQRLVRVLCRHCRSMHLEAPVLPDNVLRETGLEAGQPIELWRANGCERCANTGYQGRISIVEVMPISDSIQELIKPGVTTQQLTDVMRHEGRTSMTTDGVRKCLEGVTTLDEVRRVAFEI